MRRILLALAALFLALPAFAQAPELPGLADDAARYQSELTRRFPAGGTPQQRSAAEARATQAERANNWAGAAAAWEERVALGDPQAQHLLALARAQLQRTSPENARALQAAWLNFMAVPAGAPEIPSLLLMAQALQRLDRLPQQLQVLEAVVARAPQDQRFRAMLADARRAAGLLVARITSNAEASPPSACIGFTFSVATRGDWQPADWVRAEPAIPGLSVTREGRNLCIAGLPHGRTTRLVLRSGLPGEDNLRLLRDTPINVAMPNRAPRILFDNSRFILPRGQQARVSVATVNVSTLRMQLLRVPERGLVPALSNGSRITDLDEYSSEYLAENHGRLLWEGRAELPPLVANATQRSALPLPDALRGAGPGMYILVVRPGDGAASREITAALPVFVTDLGMTAWRSQAGLAAQLRGLSTGRVLPGARVALIARNNEVLGEAVSDADGVVRFAAPLMRGQGPIAPVALHASTDDDFMALDLEAAAFDLSDRGASGRPHPGPADAFIWLDRGIYRPGETVHASLLLRDAAGAPLDLPLRLRLRRPNGQIAAEATPPRLTGAAMLWPVALPRGAAAGMWKIEALTDPAMPPVAVQEFRVDAFVPERMEVTLGEAGPLVAGQPLDIPVNARFLYDAPAEGLAGTAEITFTAARSPFAQWPRFEFGVIDEIFEPPLATAEMPATDAQGRATLRIEIPRLPDTTRPMSARVVLSVEEPGGRASRADTTLRVQNAPRHIGIRPAFEDGAVNEGQEAAFEIIAINATAAAEAVALRWRLVREVPEWRIILTSGIPRYGVTWRSEPVEAGAIETNAAAPARLARSLPFGRYRLEVQEANGLAISSLRFRSGWAVSEAVETPDKVDVAADRAQYAPGDTARIRITPPFAGVASIAVLTDRLLSVREVAVPAGGAEVTLPIEAGWGAGAHVAVTMFRPGQAAQGQPARALGLAWLQIDPASRALTVAIEGETRILPRQRVMVPVRVTGGASAHVTLAAVDEGILRLTRFASPDPLAHFTGRRRLGVDIRDDYGRLIPPTDGEAATLRQGGDELGDLGALNIPQRNVALFSGVVAVGADGIAQVPLEVPDFAGELRLMAVAWDGARIGAASRPLTVRDPLVAEAVLPRFLAPGDEARVPVVLHNLDLAAGPVAARLSTVGGLAIAGPAEVGGTLATGQRIQGATVLRATAPGQAVLRLSATGPQGFSVARESEITIRSPRAITTEVAVIEVPAGAERALPLPADRFMAGWRATARLGGPVRYDVPGMLHALEAFPLDCTEQASSRVLGLSSVQGWAGEDRAARLQQAVNSVLNRQRFDGGFALWSAQGEAMQWLSAYATEALIRARSAGATVPDAALNAALQHLEEALEDAAEDNPAGFAAQAARVHALALGGRVRLGAARRLLEQLDRLPTPLARAQLGAAFARGGDVARAEVAFGAALAAPARNFWLADYGTAARDAMAVAVLLAESGVLPARMNEARGRLPGPELTPALANTQEQGWALLAAQALGRDGRPVNATLNGTAVAAAPMIVTSVTGATTVRNTGDAPFYASISITGTPAQALPAGRSNMRIARRFFAMNGQPLNLDTLRSGTQFVVLLEGAAESGQQHDAMLQQGLPAGWEVVARLPAGDVAGMPWLGTLSDPVATPALDDRIAAALSLTRQEPAFRLAWRIRATIPGSYELPGASLDDMYRPAFHARQNAGRITVRE